MTLRPATLSDIAEILARPVPAFHWAGLRAQFFAGRAWTIEDPAGGPPLAAAGLVPDGEGGAALWFLPGPQAPRHMRRLIGAARLTLADQPYARIWAAAGSPEGARLLSLLGFAPSPLPAAARIYMREKQDEQSIRRRIESGGGAAETG